MIISIYIACFIISVVMLILLIYSFHEHIPVYYTLLYVLFVLGNFGYCQLVTSKTLEAAIYGNQILYFCSSFAPFVVILCMANLCKIKLIFPIKAFLFVFAVSLFLCTCTVGKVPFYYKEVYFHKIGDVTVITKDYGPLHVFYPIFLIINAIASIILFVYAIINKSKVSSLVTSMISILLIAAVIAYCVKRFLHIPYDYMPLIYVLSQFLLFFVLKRMTIYDISGLSAESMLVNEVNGFLICDDKGRYAGSDNLSRKWFPELMSLRVDKKITNTSTPFLTEIFNWINGTQEKEVAYFEVGDKVIQVKHGIHYEKKRSIHCFYLSDNTQQQKYARLIENYNEDLEKRVQEKTEKIEKIKNDIITSMATIVGDRDSNTGGHVMRTSDVVKIFVKYLQQKNSFAELTEEFADLTIKAAPLHDFGKIGVPDVILNKPGKFTSEEYEQMKTHAQKGAVIVNKIFSNTEESDLFKQIAENIAYYHHEKWDGTGYPCNLHEKQIPFEARIMALADVFDALVSKRVYKEDFSYERAFEIIKDSCGTHFDPVLCEYFLECRPKLEQLYDSYEGD